MAFCPLCGKELADGETCDCQKEKTTENTPVENKETTQGSGLKLPFNLKMPKIDLGSDKTKQLALLAASVVVIILLISMIASCGSKKYMKPITNVLNAFNKKITTPLKSYSIVATPEDTRNLILEGMKLRDNYDDYMDNLKDETEDLFDDLNDDFKNWKVTFKVSKKKKLDRDDLEDIRDYIQDNLGDRLDSSVDRLEDVADDFDDYEVQWPCTEKQFKGYLKKFTSYAKRIQKAKVTAGYEIKGKFTVYKKGNREVATSDRITFTVIKLNGKWVIYDFEGNAYFDGDGSAFSVLLKAYLYSTAKNKLATVE